jgi:zinc transport system permease protein
MTFFHALAQYEFLQHAMLAGVLAAIGCGLIGTYVVIRRISFVAGGIAHAVLGGMGAALYAGTSPFAGAILAAILAALIIGMVSLKWREREDTIVGALWAIGMAIGILFIAATPGYQVDLFSYLFGNILMVSSGHLQLMAALDLVLLGMVLAFRHQFNAVIFDEEFARMKGLPVTAFYLLLLTLVALTVVLLIQVVGLILVIALLTMPAAIAGHYTRTVTAMMLLAIALGFVITSGGMLASYTYDLPSGATIILVAALLYLLSLLFTSVWRGFQNWRSAQ